MPMLQGVRVLDLSRVISGPFCSRMLGDLGAEVIKVETPSGEPTRKATPSRGGFSSLFAQYNAGKKSVCIDLREADGIALVCELAAQSDVFLENFRAGLASEIGVGYATISQANPGIIYCSISGFGQQGEDAGRPAYTDIIQALAGLDYASQNMYGNETQAPHGYPAAIADTCTSLNAAIAILAALYHREQTGAGQYIDLSMLDAMVASNDSTLQRFIFSGGKEDAPGPIYRPPLKLKDGFLAASIGLSFNKTMHAIGREDLLTDPRFSTPQLQRDNMGVFVEVARAWAATKTVSEVSTLFAANDIPFGKVNSSQDVVSSRVVNERQMLIDVDLPGEGPTAVINTPFHFSGGRSAPSGPPPALGAHTRELLTGLPDMSSERFDRLLASGVIREADT
ncbi:MAG: CoA transferase [Proteobacteria bacterium]|nr:CoA transferase [Pseudomonadota bacterium]